MESFDVLYDVQKNTLESQGGEQNFTVILENFTGPFDVLLSLIAKHEMNITEVALAVITDEFIEYIKALQTYYSTLETTINSKDSSDQKVVSHKKMNVTALDDPAQKRSSILNLEFSNENILDKISEFLVVASTLLDLKAARLVPRDDLESDEDMEFLEARDLLFARLLQFKAFKQISRYIHEELTAQSRFIPRQVQPEEEILNNVPPVQINMSLESFANLAQVACSTFESKTSQISVSHLHHSAISVSEQEAIVEYAIKQQQKISFKDLIHDADNAYIVVVRFMYLLDLFKRGQIRFEQDQPLSELQIVDI